MHAFVQRLGCGEHVFLRAGPLAKQYGDPWVWGCLGEVIGNAVTLIGYDDKSQPAPSLDALKAMVRAVFEDGFSELNFDRLGGPSPRHVVFSKGDEEGKITMKHFGQDHLKKSHTSKGVYDRKQVSADLRAMADANDASHITLITRRVTDPVNEASDGSGAKSSYAFLEWKHS